jgi:hypothetical protein
MRTRFTGQIAVIEGQYRKKCKTSIEDLTRTLVLSAALSRIIFRHKICCTL